MTIFLQVLTWQPCCEGICVPNVRLQSRLDRYGNSKMDDPSAQKNIVCHDMMGGYLKDKYIQGHKYGPNSLHYIQACMDTAWQG